MLYFGRRRNFIARILLRIAIVMLLSAAVGVAVAKPENITDVEMKLIPSYCPDTMGFNYGDAYYNTSPRAGYWVSQMGKGFWAMHHYCWAQINMNRARRSGVTEQVRKGLWESARGDYWYVVNNTPSDFIMLPEIYTRIGEVELLLGQPDKANVAFAQARNLKLDYWPAYSHWAEYLIKIGRRPDALKIVSSGLAHSPNAKVLLIQFQLLGGRSSDIPKPIERSHVDDESSKETLPDIPNHPDTPVKEGV